MKFDSAEKEIVPFQKNNYVKKIVYNKSHHPNLGSLIVLLDSHTTYLDIDDFFEKMGTPSQDRDWIREQMNNPTDVLRYEFFQARYIKVFENGLLLFIQFLPVDQLTKSSKHDSNQHRAMQQYFERINESLDNKPPLKKENDSAPVKIDIGELVLQHGKILRRFIASKMWNVQDVDDIYQSTFLEAIKSADNFKGQSTVLSWLCGIAYNLLRNAGKSKKQDTFPIEDLEKYTINTERGTSENPETVCERGKKLEKTLTCYLDLPGEMQEVVQSVLIDGQSYKKTAKQLNVPLGTIRSRVFRARKLINQCVCS